MIRTSWITRAAIALGSLMIAAACAFAEDAARSRMVGYDVVHLLRTGETIDGKPEFAQIAGLFTYQFATADNLAAFRADVSRHEIQLGGACARMGPLSGEGAPRLHAVHEGKLYIFASEQCRAAFLKNPAAYLDMDDPAPRATPESLARGRELLGRAVDGLACGAQSDAVETVRFVLKRDEQSGGKTCHVVQTLTLSCSDGVRSQECWDDSCWSHVCVGQNGWSEGGSGVTPLHASQVQAMRREHGRQVLPILWARDAADLAAASAGESRSVVALDNGGIRGIGVMVNVELVTVHRAGATTVLGVDRQGCVRLMSWRGRGPDMTIGQVERIFNDFREVGGLRLPHAVQTTFNGQPVPAQSGAFAEIVIDDPADTAGFEPPARLAAASQPSAGTRTLIHEATIAAPIQQVWDAWTTSEGFASWAVAKAQIDLRVGGDMRTSYNPQSNLDDDSTIINRILAYEPLRMLAIRNVRAPKGFKGAELFGQAWTVMHLDPVAPDRTHVRIVGMGFGDSPEWDDLYRKFDAGNAYTLDRLKKKFAPDASASDPAAVLALMKGLVGGEWIHEGTQPDGKLFRVRNIYELAPDGLSLIGRGWLGDADGMHAHGALQVHRSPGPGGAADARVMFQNIDETGAISRGEIRLIAADTLEWDWNRTTLESETSSFRLQTKLVEKDLYQFTILAPHENGWQQLAQLEFTRMDKAPERFHPAVK